MHNLIKVSEGRFVDGKGGTLVLNCTDYPLCHLSFSIQGFDIVMNVNQCTAEPHFLVRNKKIFLGAEQGIFVVNLETGVVEIEVPNVANVQWTDADAVEQVIFADEDEMIVLDNAGHLLWRKNFPDVIQSTLVAGDCIRVTDISGNDYDLSLHDGNWLK